MPVKKQAPHKKPTPDTNKGGRITAEAVTTILYRNRNAYNVKGEHEKAEACMELLEKFRAYRKRTSLRPGGVGRK